MNENAKKLLKLVKENPDLPIIPFVSTDVVAGDDFSTWMASFGDCEVGGYVVTDERVFTDKDEYIDKIIEDNCYGGFEPNWEGLSDDECYEKAKAIADEHFKAAIIVHINSPEE